MGDGTVTDTCGFRAGQSTCSLISFSTDNSVSVLMEAMAAAAMPAFFEAMRIDVFDALIASADVVLPVANRSKLSFCKSSSGADVRCRRWAEQRAVSACPVDRTKDCCLSTNTQRMIS